MAEGKTSRRPETIERRKAAAVETPADLVIVLSSGFLAMYFPQVPSRAAGGSPPRLCSSGLTTRGRPKDRTERWAQGQTVCTVHDKYIC